MKRKINVVVISDIHLGTFGCHANELVRYLKSINPSILILNGDIIDIWNFDKKYFPASHLSVIQEILKMINKGQDLYNYIEPRLMTPFVQWLCSRNLTLYFAGVPTPQRQLISNQFDGGVKGFILDCLRNIFTKHPARDNYFWYLYIFGKYSNNCRPNYLLPQNFETITARQANITTHTTSISRFLQQNPAQYSHYVLLDHQDWLANHAPKVLEEEWRLILQNSGPGTRILLRSAAAKVDYFPAFVHDKVDWQLDICRDEHQKDRVGTYGSTYLGVII